MSYQHLTPQERFFIEIFCLSGLTLREIARRLGRDHGTISRELRRNRRLDRYCSLAAEQHAVARRSRPRHYRRQTHAPLIDYVEDKLCSNWSPEQIAHRIRIDHPQDARMRISNETVYRWVYTEAGQGGRLYTHLRRRHRRRRQQKRYGSGRRFLAGRVSIAERPEIVANRSRFGDWEADLVVGGIGKGAVVTCLERKSRYLVAGKVENKTAIRFNEALDQAVAHVPSELRCTLTLDNGSEMARFKMPPGSGAATRTATACCGSISRKGATSARFRKQRSRGQSNNSIIARESVSTTGHHTRSSCQLSVVHLQTEFTADGL